MREQPTRHVTMASPTPGFTLRVMERIRERERLAERRRALVGAGFLVLAGFVPFVLLGILLASAWSALFAEPELLISGIVALAPALDIMRTVLDALWLGSMTVASAASSQLLVYAVGVLVLTLLWVRVASGPFQFASHNVEMGGPR